MNCQQIKKNKSYKILLYQIELPLILVQIIKLRSNEAINNKLKNLGKLMKIFLRLNSIMN